jgi:hypothetical protein
MLLVWHSGRTVADGVPPAPSGFQTGFEAARSLAILMAAVTSGAVSL